MATGTPKPKRTGVDYQEFINTLKETVLPEQTLQFAEANKTLGHEILDKLNNNNINAKTRLDNLTDNEKNYIFSNICLLNNTKLLKDFKKIFTTHTENCPVIIQTRRTTRRITPDITREGLLYDITRVNKIIKGHQVTTDDIRRHIYEHIKREDGYLSQEEYDKILNNFNQNKTLVFPEDSHFVEFLVNYIKKEYENTDFYKISFKLKPTQEEQEREEIKDERLYFLYKAENVKSSIKYIKEIPFETLFNTTDNINKFRYEENLYLARENKNEYHTECPEQEDDSDDYIIRRFLTIIDTYHDFGNSAMGKEFLKDALHKDSGIIKELEDVNIPSKYHFLKVIIDNIKADRTLKERYIYERFVRLFDKPTVTIDLDSGVDNEHHFAVLKKETKKAAVVEFLIYHMNNKSANEEDNKQFADIKKLLDVLFPKKNYITNTNTKLNYVISEDTIVTIGNGFDIGDKVDKLINEKGKKYNICKKTGDLLEVESIEVKDGVLWVGNVPIDIFRCDPEKTKKKVMQALPDDSTSRPTITKQMEDFLGICELNNPEDINAAARIIYDIKRAGDFLTAQSALAHDAVFVTHDYISAAYAIHIGCDVIIYHQQEGKIRVIKNTPTSDSFDIEPESQEGGRKKKKTRRVGGEPRVAASGHNQELMMEFLTEASRDLGHCVVPEGSVAPERLTPEVVEGMVTYLRGVYQRRFGIRNAADHAFWMYRRILAERQGLPDPALCDAQRTEPLSAQGKEALGELVAKVLGAPATAPVPTPVPVPAPALAVSRLTPMPIPSNKKALPFFQDWIRTQPPKEQHTKLKRKDIEPDEPGTSYRETSRQRLYGGKTRGARAKKSEP